MGATQSSDFYNPYSGDYAVDDAEVTKVREDLRKMGIVGANEQVLGHALAALNSRAKDRMIRDLADDFGRAMGIPALTSKDKTTQEILDAIAKNFPGPSKVPGKSFIVDADKQKKMVTIMGKLLNKHSGKTIIDLNADHKTMAKQIGEVLYALSTSVFAEYNTIRNEINTVLSNIETTEEIMKKFHSQLLDIARSNKDAELMTEKFEEAYKEARREHDKQTMILKSLLDSESKPNPELDKIIAETGNFHKAIKEIKGEPGSKDFSDTISYAFGLYRTNAQLSKIVEEKLKVLDMTLKQYKELANLSQLEKQVAKHIEEGLKDSVDPQQLQDMVNAMRALVYAFPERENLTTGAGESKVGGLKLDKRVEKSKKLHRALIVAFHSAINRNLEAFTYAGNCIADCADKLPNIPELDTFMKMLDQLPEIDRKVYFSLIGDKPNILATQDRESYISHAKALIESIKVLESKKVQCSEHFRDMRLSLEGLIETLSVFSKKFAEGIDFRTDEKVGAWDIGGIIKTVGDKASSLSNKAQEQLEKLPERIDKAAEQVSKIAASVGNAAQSVGQSVATAQEQVTGVAQQMELQKLGRGEDVTGGFYDEDLGIDLPEINRVSKNFERTKSVIKYRHRVAMIRENMKNASMEAPHYSEDYESVTGRSVANLVNDSNKKVGLYKQLLQVMSAGTVPANDISVTDYQFLGKRYTDAGGILQSYNVLRTAAAAQGAGPVALQAEVEFRNSFKLALETLIRQEETKFNLYKSAESIDLYLKNFGEHMIKHPEALQDIFNILDSTEISTKWFDATPGDRLCEVFESFPYGFSRQQVADNNLNIRFTNISGVGKDLPKYHYYAHVLAVTGLAEVNNGDYVELGKYVDAVNPSNATTADVLAALSGAAEAPGLNGVQKQNLVPAAGTFAHVGNPYIFLQLTDDTRKKLIKNVEGSLETGILKNIMSMFVSIGNKFGDENLSKSAPISPILVYKNLRSYMLHSAYSLGSSQVSLVGAQVNLAGPFDQLAVTTAFTEAVPNNRLPSNTGDALEVGVPGDRATQAVVTGTGITMRSVNPNIAALTDDIFGSQGQVTDQIFVSIIKSMIAKIFVTIGTYNMLNRPANVDGIGYRAPLRLILGAGDSVKVIPEAVELYIRLPLLAEWYREILKLDETATSKFIGMLPEADGTFSNFIDLFFDKLKFVNEGTYSDTDIVNIVSEINKLFAKFGTVRHVVDELVNEINKRIGVLDGVRSKEYNDLRKKRNPYSQDNQKKYSEAPTDFALSTIDEDDNTNRPTPSSLFTSESSYLPDKSKLREILNWTETKKIADDFYKKIDNGFSKIDDILELDQKYSFNKLVATKTLEVKNAQNEDEKLRIIKAAITSIGKFTPSGKEPSLVLFHELVIYPLQQIGLMYDLTENFFTVISNIHRACSGISGFVEAGAVVPATQRYLRKDNNGMALSVNGRFPRLNILGAAQALDYKTRTDIAAVIVAGPDADDFKKFVNAYLLNPQTIVDDLLESVYRVCAQGLATYDVIGDADNLILTVNFSKMRETVGVLIGDVKKNIDKFRGVIDPVVIEKYEKGSQSWSLYNLENKFYNVRLDGKAEVTDTLDYLNQKIKTITDAMFGEHEVAPANNVAIGKIRYNHEDLVRRYVMLRGGAAARNLSDKFISMVRNRTNKTVLGLSNRPIAPGGEMINTRTTLDYNRKALNFDNQSVTGILVHLLIEYISTVYDDTTSKFYLTTLNNLMNSDFGNSILRDDGGVNDTAAFTLDNISELIPRSLCNVLKYSFNHSDVTTNNKIYIATDLSSMPQFYKNKLSALLPVFTVLLENIVKKINIVNSVVKVGRFSLAAPNTHVLATYAGSAEIREKINRIYDRELDLCNVLLTSIKDTLTELSDNSAFFEPTKGFIESYKHNTGKSPLMLNSTLSYRYKNIMSNVQLVVGTFDNVLPGQITSSDFKFVYGTKSLFKSEVTPDDFPGLKSLVEHHNVRSANQFHFDIKDLVGFLQRSHDMHRYLENSLVFRNATNCARDSSYFDIIPPTQNITYEWKVNAEMLIRFTEDTDQNTKIKEFIQVMYGSPDMETVKLDDQRNVLRKYNIIDLNIVPINVNALKRELPLINLINYSWTFDKMMEDMLDDKNNTGKLLCDLMLNPYQSLSHHSYFDIFPRIVRGNTGIEGLGRPQYLGEEIYNKALFGEVHSNLKDVSPASASSKKEGRTLKQAILDAVKYVANVAVLDNSNLGYNRNGGIVKRDVENGLEELEYFLNTGDQAGLPTGLAPASSVTHIADSLIYALSIGIKNYDLNQMWAQANPVTKILSPGSAVIQVNNVASNFTLDQIAKIREILDVKYDGDSDTVALQPEDTISYPYYDKQTKQTELVTLKMQRGTRAILHNAGYLRFETVLVRNIVWLTNIQRLVRLALRRELFWHDTNIVSKNAATSSGVTELYGNDLREIVKPGYNPYVPFRY